MADSTLIPANFADVTPSDTVPLPGRTIGLYVGVAGDVIVKGADGVQATLTVASAGSYLTGRFRMVMAATSASGIVAQLEA